jgi:hypothetical protein
VKWGSNTLRTLLFGIGKMGIGMASVLLIARWMTADVMFSAAEASVTYGLLAGPAFGMLGLVAFFCFGLMGQRVRNDMLKANSLIDVLRHRMSPHSVSWFMFMITIASIIELFVIGLGGGIVLYSSFEIPLTIGMLIFFSLSLPLLAIHWLKSMGKYNVYKAGLFLSIIMMIFVYLFLTTNLESMFFGMRLYHPYLFIIQKDQVFLYVAAVFVILFGRVCIDPTTWNILFRLKKPKVRRSFVLAGSIWGTIPLAFSTIIYPALYQGGFQNITTIFHSLFQLFHSYILMIVLTVVLLVVLMTTFQINFQESIRFFQSNSDKKVKHFPHVLAFFTIVTLFMGYLYLESTILDLFFFLGILYSSFLVPMVTLIFIKKKFGLMIPFSILFSMLLGYVSLLFVDRMQSVLISVITSSIVVGLIIVSMKWKEGLNPKV